MWWWCHHTYKLESFIKIWRFRKMVIEDRIWCSNQIQENQTLLQWKKKERGCTVWRKQGAWSLWGVCSYSNCKYISIVTVYSLLTASSCCLSSLPDGSGFLVPQPGAVSHTRSHRQSIHGRLPPHQRKTSQAWHLGPGNKSCRFWVEIVSCAAAQNVSQPGPPSCCTGD